MGREARDPRLAVAIERSAVALRALLAAAGGLLDAPPRRAVAAAEDRGFFRPDEEEALVDWFARFLTVRDGLWEVLADLIGARGGDIEGFFAAGAESVESAEFTDGANDRWRAFVLGYAAACGVVRLDSFLLDDLAADRLIQRKLNQGFAERRIPRKLYTAIFSSFTEPSTALLLDQAIDVRLAADRRLRASAADGLLADVVARLDWLEASLDRSKRVFLRRFARFQRHALKRRAATVRDHGFFSVLESSGRLASEIRDRWRPKRVSPEVREELGRHLRPGDVLVTRHGRALTNLFLPGFWPHAALYVGAEADRQRLGVALEKRADALWRGPVRTLEALKDGVRFRTLEETLGVDAVAVIRPAIPEAGVAEALGRAALHEGKGYNFDFDFFRSDRLVCTEVIYRAYDGVHGLRLPMSQRAGRPTLSAEDLLDLALDRRGFEVVAVFGTPDAPDTLRYGAAAVESLRRSYRD
ncbi:MAG: YiiX/YebB-like N1pC/P60 family cysteine hydrolase [Acidobacteriota bacterium]